MLSKVKNHLLVAFIFFILTLGQQYLFYLIKGIPIIWLAPAKLASIFVFLLVLSFAKGPKTKLVLLSFVLILNYFQMAHLSYFGTQILPVEIYLLFTQSNEIFGLLGTEFTHTLIPLIFTLLPVSLGYFFLKKFPLPSGHHAITFLFIAYFIYNPVRTFITGNTWGRQPSTRELSGMNVYLSFSYFLGRILPLKISRGNHVDQDLWPMKLNASKNTSDWDNVIIVLGESLSANHMSLFGGTDQTTPFLNKLKTDPQFYFAKAISSGVSTDISVAFFMNLAYGNAGAIKAAKGDHCLFKMAKDYGRTTHFLSIQSEDQLRYISPYLCSSSLDDLRSLEQIAPETENPQAAMDRVLIPVIGKILETPGKRFIILHQRGSHAPWELRASEEAKKFLNKTDKRIAHYYNSIYEFDLFWKELYSTLKKNTQKTLVIYLSDHGEAMGENKKWGHGFLEDEAFEIPVIIQAFNHPLPVHTRNFPEHFTQYNLGLYILREMGWDTNQSPYETLNDFSVYGNDIDGLAGQAMIKYLPHQKYQYQVIP